MPQSMDREGFFPDGPMESQVRIRRLYAMLAVSLSCLLLAVAGYEIARFRADARPVTQALASVIAPVSAMAVLGRLTFIRLSDRWSAGSRLPAIVLFALLLAGTIALSLVTGAAVLIASMSLGKVLKEAASNFRLLGQARSAASTLSDIILRVEQTVHRARIHEMTCERRRVAREIHDSVGYTLTGLIVQLGVVNRLVTSPEARNRIGNLETIARQALQEVREEVGVLRAEVNEDVVPFLNRVIQEGLTNAYRHGEATIVDVSMTWKEERGLILLRISDNGRGLDSLKPGNGLNGIRRRQPCPSHFGSFPRWSQSGAGEHSCATPARSQSSSSWRCRWSFSSSCSTTCLCSVS